MAKKKQPAQATKLYPDVGEAFTPELAQAFVKYYGQKIDSLINIVETDPDVHDYRVSWRVSEDDLLRWSSFTPYTRGPADNEIEVASVVATYKKDDVDILRKYQIFVDFRTGECYMLLL